MVLSDVQRNLIVTLIKESGIEGVWTLVSDRGTVGVGQRNRLFPSCLLRLCQNKSDENAFSLQVHFHAIKLISYEESL